MQTKQILKEGYYFKSQSATNKENSGLIQRKHFNSQNCSDMR